MRGALKISPGNVVKPTGTDTGGGVCPAAAASAWTCPLSQYALAAEAPVPVSQYIVMLSRMLSRVRLPDGFPSTNASRDLHVAVRIVIQHPGRQRDG